ncbi:MAG TPA: 4Fe-4S dicluster domain-containing protein [Symbiobacteriaceae bacterium]|jgi:ferredoxin-type protein NapH
MWHRLRRLVQLIAAALLLSPLAGFTFFLGTYSASLLFGRLHLADPYAALQVGVLPLAVAALPVVLLNLLLGRVFCGWICPLGLLLEGVDALRRTLRLKDRRVPDWLGWALAGGLLAGGLLAGQPLFERFSPQGNLARLLLFGLAWEALILPVVALADLLVARRFWCRTLCPAGVTFGLLSRLGALRVALDAEHCGRCGHCLTACPQSKFVLQDAVSGKGVPIADPSACIACGECIDVCPSDALAFRFDPSPDPGRRQALVMLGAAALVTAFGRSARAAMTQRPRPALRPPGAQTETLFQALCIRCGKCAQVCPRKAIRLDNGSPYIEPRREGCDLCNKCVDICPSGALSLRPGEKIHMGVAEIDHSRCLPSNGVLCRSCFVVCPLQGKALKLDESRSPWTPMVDPRECVGCGLCEHVCPVDPAAIIVRFDP